MKRWYRTSAQKRAPQKWELVTGPLQFAGGARWAVIYRVGAMTVLAVPMVHPYFESWSATDSRSPQNSGSRSYPRTDLGACGRRVVLGADLQPERAFRVVFALFDKR